MATPRPARVNIRSNYVRKLTDDIARRTGMTTTRIIEEALARYIPLLPTVADNVPPGMRREGRILVATGGRPVTIEQVQASIDETRDGVRD